MREVLCLSEDVMFCRQGLVADTLRGSRLEKEANGLKKINNGDFRRRAFVQKKKLHKKKNAFSREGKSHG